MYEGRLQGKVTKAVGHFCFTEVGIDGFCKVVKRCELLWGSEPALYSFSALTSYQSVA